jgi:hypothetical protein
MSIDPPGCVDIDDALSLRELPNGRKHPRSPADRVGLMPPALSWRHRLSCLRAHAQPLAWW